MLRFRILLIFCSILLCGKVVGQLTEEIASPYISIYGTNEGLPGNEIFDLEMDHLGQLWICSNNGVVCYNGIEFKSYGLKSASQSVIGATKDGHGEMWFWTVRGEILKYDATKDALTQIYPNKNLANITHNIITDALVTDDKIYLSARNLLIELGLDSFGNEWYLKEKTVKRGEINLLIIGEEAIAFGHRIPLAEEMNLNIYEGDVLKRQHRIPISATSQGRYRCIASNGTWYLQAHDFVIAVDAESLDITSTKRLIRLTPSIECIENEVFVGQTLQGAAALNITKGSIRSIPVDGTSVTSFEQDHLGNVWMATLEMGLAQYSSNLTYFQPRTEFAAINGAWSLNNDFVFVTEPGRIYKISEVEGEYKLELIRSFATMSSTPVAIDSSIYILTIGGSHSYHHKTGIWKQNVEMPRRPLRQSALDDGNFLIYNKAGNCHDTARRNVSYGRIRNHFDVSSKGSYIGNFSYTFYYNHEKKELSGLQPDSTYEIRCAVHLGNDSSILGTSKWGMVLTHEENIIAHLQTNRQDLRSVNFLVRHNGKIWATSHTGLFSIESIENGIVTPHYWNDVLHIGKCNINGLYAWGDLLVLNCSKGLLVFDPAKLNSGSLHPEIIDLKIETDEITYQNPLDRIKLNHKKASFTIHPKALMPLGKTSVNYRYQISSIDTVWRTQAGGKIDITSLPIGEHEIAVSAQSQLGTWSSKSKRIFIDVEPPFWRTNLFVVIVSLLAATLIYLIISYRIRRVKAKATLEMHIVEAQNKALSLQLNPHFVFNSLNSVIASITQDNKKTALSYLSNFAKLMRNIFEHSQYPLISLDEEIQAVRHFVKLESDRLDHSFDFTLSIQNDLHYSHFMIPPLVIQPIIENAIWHGVIPLAEKKGFIKMEISRDSNCIRIKISDNGNGTEKQTASHKKIRKLHSLDLIRQRFKLLNKVYNNSFSLNSTSLPNGFVVDISIPIIKNKTENNKSDESNNNR